MLLYLQNLGSHWYFTMYVGGSSSGGRVGWLVTAMLLVRVSRCPWARHLTITAPDELAVALHCWLRRWCVNVCMNGWMLGNILRRFRWPQVTKKHYIIAVHLPFQISMSSDSSDRDGQRIKVLETSGSAVCCGNKRMFAFLRWRWSSSKSWTCRSLRSAPETPTTSPT